MIVQISKDTSKLLNLGIKVINIEVTYLEMYEQN